MWADTVKKQANRSFQMNFKSLVNKYRPLCPFTSEFSASHTPTHTLAHTYTPARTAADRLQQPRQRWTLCTENPERYESVNTANITGIALIVWMKLHMKDSRGKLWMKAPA